MKRALLVILIVSVFLVAACTTTNPPSSNGEDSSQEQNTETNNKPNIKENIPTANAVEIDMIARQWEFEPSTVTVNEGDTVKLNIESIDVAHGFAINQFGVNSRLNPGQTTTVEFTADKKGTYTFFCSVQCGIGHGGMRGTLIVN